MNKPRICTVIVNDDLEAIKAVEPITDLFEVRIDLIGHGWRELIGQLKKPWIACNRIAGEGGSWHGSEAERMAELLRAVELGADVIDLELGTESLAEIVKRIDKRAKLLLSYHDFKGTPPLDNMRGIVERQLQAGADICKIVTTAQSFEDNLAVLQLISDYPKTRVVSFAMGPSGFTSRVFCPLVGGDFTYASIEKGKESAPGQVTAKELTKIYGMLADGK
ncbi:type I 3-dehydroquinate dehydratase [Chloroflexota bacterium]